MNTNFTPAFPTWVNDDSMMPGMTLRDYFAAMVMQGLLTITPKDWNEAYKNDEEYLPMLKGVPLIAYEFADEMMKARK